MAAWDRWFSNDEDSYYFCGGPHQEDFCPDFDESSWMGPSQYEVDTILSVEQTISLVRFVAIVVILQLCVLPILSQ